MTAEPTPEAATDALVVAARADRKAFGRLYDIYHPRIFGYCLRRLSARTAAEDATANVFLQVASHLPTFPGRTVEDFQRWLYRIAINEVNATIRKHIRRERHWEQVKHAKASEGGNGETNEGPPGSLTWPALHEAISRLSSREQTIVVLRFYQGMSHEEIWPSAMPTKRPTSPPPSPFNSPVLGGAPAIEVLTIPGPLSLRLGAFA